MENRKVSWTHGILDDTDCSRRREGHAAQTRSKRWHGQEGTPRAEAGELHFSRLDRRVYREGQKARWRNNFAKARGPKRRVDSNSRRPRGKPHRPVTASAHVNLCQVNQLFQLFL